ncbi:hypothetical protein UlMin_044415 [Ulmus minor]
MEQGSTKKLKGSNGLPMPIGYDNSKTVAGNASLRSDYDIEYSTDGSNGNTEGDKPQRSYGTESMQSSDIDTKVHAQISSATEGEENETSNKVSEITVTPMGFSGYVGSTFERAGKSEAHFAYAGAGFPCDGFALDERQLKRERRKQANRESARRSRLKKQAEYEEFVKTCESLTKVNMTLRSELEELKEKSAKLRLENAALMERVEFAPASQQGGMGSGKVGASVPRVENVRRDRNNHEKSTPESKLHQLIESNSRTDSVAAR